MAGETLVTKCDDRGRLYLEKGIRKEYGQMFIVVREPGELILLPVPKDPLRHFQQLGKKPPKASVKTLKEGIRKQAAKDVS